MTGTTTSGGVLQFIREAKLIVNVLGEVTPGQDLTAGQEIPAGGGTTVNGVTTLPTVEVVASKPKVQQISWDLSALRFKFQVFAADVSTPNYAVIHVYNLSDKTAQTIFQQFGTKATVSGFEFQSTVVLQAGYNKHSGQIFSGSIRQIYVGRESPTDTYLCIVAADGDMFFQYATMNATLDAAKNTPQGIVDAILATSNAHFVENGFQTPASNMTSKFSSDTFLSPPNPSPRGKVLFGMARAALNDWSRTHGVSWSIQNGVMIFTANNSYRPGDVFVMSASTGMIGIPQQTAEGIKIRCLINPLIEVGGLVELKTSDVLPGQVSAESFFGAPTALGALSQQEIGKYRVYVIEYVGDTRGQDWYCDLTCLTIDDTGKQTRDTSGNA